jgi:hypothetical protein
MLLKELNLIDEIKFVHPKDVQDGKIELSRNDITTNLPFDKRVGLAFDHHESELIRNKQEEYLGKYIIDGKAKSAARVVYDYYGAELTFDSVSQEIMEAVFEGYIDHSLSFVTGTGESNSFIVSRGGEEFRVIVTKEKEW